MRIKKTIAEDLGVVMFLNKLHKGETFKKRAERSLETKPRDMGEKKIERDIIFALKNRGFEVVKSGEQSTYNSQYVMLGMSDLLVFVEKKGVIFMEVKQEKYRTAKDGGLRYSQVKFRDLCGKCNLKHVVVYSVADAIEVMK